MPNTLIKVIPGSRVRFVYKNWRGEQKIRTCIVESFGVGVTEHHPKPVQWFLNGFDLDKQERRCYAVADIEPSSMEPF